MITGNKGEWSEIYALFKLLGDKQLYPGNHTIERMTELVYPVLKILRTESTTKLEYSIQDEFVLISDDIEVARIPVTTFKEKALFLLQAIKSNKQRTFSVPEVEHFMELIHCLSLKAKSSSKRDITVVVHDYRTGQQPALGFSIKSQLGSPSTLLNAGQTTNFVYKLSNLHLDELEIEAINSIDTRSKIKDRIEAILKQGGKFEFQHTKNQIFSSNLILIDSLLPRLLSELVFEFYTSNLSKMIDLVNEVKNKNPLHFNLSNKHPFYSYKIKRFLTDIALGMMPSKIWTGQYDATGGYLIVKEDGELLCYHIYSKNEFEDYLIHNTKLDTASSSRHKFGQIIRNGDDLEFVLNLQIRFIK